MYPRMEREFDRMIKKATPYLIFSPNNVRDTIADYMKSLWRAMRTNNTNDFDTHCTNINEAIANSDSLTDGTLQIDISDFDGRWSSLDESISKLRKELLDLKIVVKNIKQDSSSVTDGVEGRKRGRPKKAQGIDETESPPSPQSPPESPPFPQSPPETPPSPQSPPETPPSPQSPPETPPSQPLERPKCIHCSKKLSKNGQKKGRQLYICDKRTGGCGKPYIIDERGELMPKQ